ncbi:hypothetical protein OQ483_23740 (plasmid) [Enterobacter bugandensis]|uniref:hypothetical protein n=1 Tax=Enterobacter bugandensis TaxID=881260 RepID=UPI00283AA818|nr:hypothetical protein [Enterobacter bugandensis]WMU75409.1 hypothetical protein OQ483_23740 [Enterobacter bugandensis]
MAEKRTPPAVTPVSDAVQEQIHYDTLWSVAQNALALYAGQRWTARGDADPGITLMQAFTWGVSDVSYRHTLPLEDLLSADKDIPAPLTDERLDHHNGIFAAEFGPERALTSSPVTLEDYRRGLLDLTVDINGEPRFCFRDVQIALQPEDADYIYVYDEKSYTFNFATDRDKDVSRVRGAYRLWLTLSPGVAEKKVTDAVLIPWLKAHRNLCEWEIGDIRFVKTEVTFPDVQLVLDDDLAPEAISPAVAGAIWAINQVLLPSPVRQKAAGRLAAGETAEQVYNGPQLKYGWISQLPPGRETSKGTLEGYALPAQALSAVAAGSVTGIDAVEWNDSADAKVPEEQQLQFWVDGAGALAPGWSEHVKIYKRGQDITEFADQKEISEAYNRLSESVYLACPDGTRSVQYGRDRHPGFYRTIGSSLPPVYGLQQNEDAFRPGRGDKNAQQLLLFLYTFEQLLANSAEQLRLLPRLLAFDGRDINSIVWGASGWAESPGMHDDLLAYEQRAALLDGNTRLLLFNQNYHQAQDQEKELAILNYLLRYFGETRATRTGGQGAGESDDFVAVQQGFLRQVTRLAYDRAAISISRVSALQRKIAARLGVGRVLFSEALQKPDSPFPDGTMPFYLIEHQELLPKAPKTSEVRDEFPAGQTAGTPVPDHEPSPETLTLTLTGSSLRVGQLVDLQGTKTGGKPDEPLMANIIHAVEGNRVTFVLNENDRLRRSLPSLQDKENYTWAWRVSKVWLKPVLHGLLFASGPDTSGKATLRVDVAFPVGLEKGARFALRPERRWDYQPTKDGLTKSKDQPDIVVEVVDADPLGATVVVKGIASSIPKIDLDSMPLTVPPVDLTAKPDSNFAWPPGMEGKNAPLYAWSVPVNTETFAFTLSVVLDRSLLKSGNPTEMNQWIETIVREEMPSHLNLQLHWIDNFGSFARQYQAWQNSDRPVGDLSYGLLRMLGLGERPVDIRSGIGFVRVASVQESKDYEAEVNGKDGPASEALLLPHSVVYVKK